MGKLILFAAVLVAGSVGYFLWNTKPDAPSPSVVTGYTQGLQSSEKHAEAAASSSNVENIKMAVEKYKNEKGSAPASLQDLVPNYLDHIPGGIQYDASTGVVSAAP